MSWKCRDCADNKTVKATHFRLYDRAKHVFTEALRVLQFRQICLDASRVQDNDEMVARSTITSCNKDMWLEKLGELMNNSQQSCMDLFECSCYELDQLTRLARDAGAFGSRLTGCCGFFFHLQSRALVNTRFLFFSGQEQGGVVAPYHWSLRTTLQRSLLKFAPPILHIGTCDKTHYEIWFLLHDRQLERVVSAWACRRVCSQQ